MDIVTGRAQPSHEPTSSSHEGVPVSPLCQLSAGMVPGVVHGLGTRALGTHRRWRSPRTAATDGTSRARSRFGGASHRPRRRGTTAAPSRLQPPKTGPAGRGRAAADSAIQRITFLAHRWAGLVRGWSECTRRYPGYHRGEGPKRTRPSFQFLPCQCLLILGFIEPLFGT